MRTILVGLLFLMSSALSFAQTTVSVNVTDDLGTALAGLNVYAFDGTAYTGNSAVTDASGIGSLSLADGSYRFRVDYNGTQYFSQAGNHCTTPGCTSINVQVPRPVAVTVTSSGGGVEAGLNVYAFDGSTYSGKSSVTDAAGVANLQLLDGNYRFRIDKNGTQFYTGAVNHCAAPGCAAVAYEVPESVTVTVTTGGAPEEGLNVYGFDGTTYSGKSGVTDANGEAVLTLLPGDYRFRIDKAGTQFFTDDVNHCSVPGCNAANLDLPMQIMVNVTSSAGGPESGLNVYAFDNTTYSGKSAVTDVSGIATFTLPVGDYRFRIDKNGTQFYTDDVNHCTAPGCTSVDYEIPEDITVTVSSSAGGFESGLNVYAFDGTTYSGKSGVTDANGEAVFTLLPGDYSFRIDKNGTQFFTDDVNHCSAPGCTVASLEIPENVVVTVTSSGGGFEAGLNVYAFDGSTYSGKSAVTDGNGQATFTLLPGDYRFRIDKSGTQFFTDDVNHCTAPGCTAVSFEIPENVVVTVTSSGGGFEVGLNVYAFNGTTYSGKSAVTDASGEATFTLDPGDYRFRIDKNGTQFFTDSVNHCTAPGCTAVSYEVPESVQVTVMSSGGGFEEGLNVYAFDGTTYSGKSGVTDVNGIASLTLLLGNYRFRIDKNGTQFFTDTVNHCAVPGCATASYEVPVSTTVTVTNSAGGVESGLNVYAFDEAVYSGKSAVTDANGDAEFTLLPGNYRFRVDKGGSQFFSNPTNHCAVPGCTSIAQVVPAALSAFVIDPALGACLDAAGSANGWSMPSEVTSLSCASAGVTNLSGIQSFGNLTNLSLGNNAITLLDALSGLTNLTSLDLSGNTQVECHQLGDLELTLGAGVITQPSSCLGEGEQVFNVSNPSKPDTNQFSFAVASTDSGDLLSSAITFNPGTSSFDGRVYLIDGTNGNELLEVLNPNPTGSDYFGWSIAALPSGNIAVGAWQDDAGGVASGAVHLFSGSDGSLLQSIENPNPTIGDRFGYSIAVNGNGTLAVGAYQEAGGGAVYVYDAAGILQQTISNPTVDSNAEFGKSVSANFAGEIVIGAPKQDVSDGSLITDAGAVYIYSEIGGIQELIVDNPQPAANDDFGSTVAVTSTDDIIVSARFVDNFASNDGSVFLLDGTNGAELWSTANPVADAEGLFGAALAGSPQGHVVVGAANDDTNESNSGKVFVFDGSTGELVEFISNPLPGANFNFGQGLAVTPAGQIAVGAFGADGGFGELYLFSSVRNGSPLPLLNNLPFTDSVLQSCVLDEAAANGWATVGEMTSLVCDGSGITDLTGIDALLDLATLDLSNNPFTDISLLENLTNLTALDLTGNDTLQCTDLDDLETVLGAGVVTRPESCAGGGGEPGSTQVQSLHNAMGQRVAKTVNGDASTTIHFIYDQNGQVIAEIDSNTGQTLREYIYVNGLQVALVDDTGSAEEETYFVHSDHLGTPQKISDDQQAVVWGASYEPFGEVTETVADIENNIRFPGQYEDSESGLNYNYFRDYDPSLGRYVESDPIGLVGGVNTYVYAFASPTNLLDDFGLQSTSRSSLRTSRATARQQSSIRQQLLLQQRIRQLRQRQFERGQNPGAIGNSIDQLNKEMEALRKRSSPIPMRCVTMVCPWDQPIPVPPEQAAVCEIPKPKPHEMSPPRDFRYGCSCLEWRVDPSQF
ncbi:MAG: hypothetical protein GKR91_11980 [Pseudomonadales bacterium]|nr:hypothetical protein [Pseudomonadales bacterium]